MPWGYVILVVVPVRGAIPGNTETLAQGVRLCIGTTEGGPMIILKKPIRLLGMVFQIDR